MGAYARTLAHAAKIYVTRSPTKSFSRREQNDVVWRFVFLARKQKAHPGYSAHALLTSCLAKAADPNKPLLFFLTKAIKCDVKSLADHLNDKTNRGVISLLKDLSELPEKITDITSPKLRLLIENFDRMISSFANPRQGRLFIVTHGYSRTVREVLTRERGEWLSKEKRNDSWKKEDHEVFLLLDDSRGAIDTRIMEYELKANARSSNHEMAPIEAGGGNILKSMVRKRDRILFVLGVECFDESGWALHPRGLHSYLEKGLLSDLRGLCKHVRVVAVAQSFKKQPNFLRSPEHYEDHFDRIDLYPPGVIENMITDAGVLSFMNTDDHDRIPITEIDVFPSWMASSA